MTYHESELQETRDDKGRTGEESTNGDPLKRLLQEVDPGNKERIN